MAALNDWALAQTSWLSLLVSKGDIIRRTTDGDDGSWFMVLFSCEFYVGVWPLQREQGAYLMPQTQPGARMTWVLVNSLIGWEVCQALVLPPLGLARRIGKKTKVSPSGIGAFDTGDTDSILVTDARSGFRNLTSPFLCKLAALLDLGWESLPKEERPRTMEQRVHLLVQAAIPEATGLEIAECLRARSSDQQRSSGALDMTSMVCDGIFDVADLKKIAERASARSTATAAEKRMCEYVRGSVRLEDGPPIAGSAGSKATAKTKAVELAQDPKPKHRCEASKLLPQVPGCSVQRIDARRCYIAFYPGGSPASRSRTWGGNFSDAQCRTAVLRWAWGHHSRLTRQQCPHDL